MKNSPEKTAIKVFGIGGAGCNALNAFARQRAADILSAENAPQSPDANSNHSTFQSGDRISAALSLIALNCDAQSLASCAVTEKFCLGAKLTHGLGAGGDPEIGRTVAESDLETLQEFCTDARIAFVICGLGGGTGTGASSVLARVAKESGALVVAIVTTPFEFEGGRRHRQAQFGLQQLKAVSDAVICLPNQRVFKLIDDKTTVIDTFNAANQLLAQGVAGISRLLTQTGLINIDFADLCTVTRNLHADSSFATVEAIGENRAQEIVEKIFGHPMLEDGELLDDSDSILVSLAGGSDLTMAEVNHVMGEINTHCKHAHVIFGAAIDETFANRLSITIVASGRKEHQEKDSAANLRSAKTPPHSVESGPQLLNTETRLRPPSRVVAPAPELTETGKEQLLSKQGGRQRKNASRMRQRELPLEIISKGRFEKSEPTIHRGEDLDLPTYIRRGIALN